MTHAMVRSTLGLVILSTVLSSCVGGSGSDVEAQGWTIRIWRDGEPIAVSEVRIDPVADGSLAELEEQVISSGDPSEAGATAIAVEIETAQQTWWAETVGGRETLHRVIEAADALGGNGADAAVGIQQNRCIMNGYEGDCPDGGILDCQPYFGGCICLC